MSRILILSDGRPGHEKQSIALAKYLGVPYDIINVKFKYKWLKALSYFFDRLGICSKYLFEADVPKVHYDLVTGAGSTTYYAIKVLAKAMKVKSVVMMLPKGYRFDFDIIFAQSHDDPPKQDGIIEIPVNFSYIEPKGIYNAQKKSIGIVIGGNNKIFSMSTEDLRRQLDFLRQHYKGYEIAITTSPRTSREIEVLVHGYKFDYEVIYSENPINPIPDFLDQCETVFITGDSTSMISEAVAYGESNVVVLPLRSQGDNKFTRFVSSLAREGYLYFFNGKIVNKNKKIDFGIYTEKVVL